MVEFSSSPSPLTCGAPQRSILGPLVLRLDLIIAPPCTLDLIIWLFPINCSSKILLQDCWQTADHISPILASLYWLPVEYRIDFKILNLIHYFQSPSCPCTIRHQRFTLLSKSVSVCAPRFWISLPQDLRSADSVMPWLLAVIQWVRRVLEVKGYGEWPLHCHYQELAGTESGSVKGGGSVGVVMATRWSGM